MSATAAANPPYKHRTATMTLQEKKRMQRQFFKSIGPNTSAIVSLFNRSNDIGFYIKDIKGRIMALNRRNCEICNMPNEWYAVGRTSAELFPPDKAESYASHDRQVRLTGKPVLDWVSQYPADDSLNVERGDVHPLFSASGKLIGTICAYTLEPADNEEETRHKNLKLVAEYIQQHYSERLKVGQLATIAKMSETAFSRSFKKLFGITTVKFITITRLNAARQLLEDTDKQIGDIASETGFFDQSHFCRVFKAIRKISPNTYRQNHNTGNKGK